MHTPKPDGTISRALLCMAISAGLHAGVGFVEWDGPPAQVAGLAPGSVAVALVDYPGEAQMEPAPETKPQRPRTDSGATVAEAAEQPARRASSAPVRTIAKPAPTAKPEPTSPAARLLEEIPLCMPAPDRVVQTSTDSLTDVDDRLMAIGVGTARASAETLQDGSDALLVRASPVGLPDSQSSGARSGGELMTRAKPMYSSNPRPVYPRLARLKRWEGTVWIQAHVTPRGTVDALSVDRTSGYPVLDESALEAVRRWQFQPARSSGVAVDCDVRIPVQFQLERF